MAKIKIDKFLNKKVSFQDDDKVYIGIVSEVNIKNKTLIFVSEEKETYEVDIKDCTIIEENTTEIPPEDKSRSLISEDTIEIKKGMVNLILVGKFYSGYDEGLASCPAVNATKNSSVIVTEKFAKRVMKDFPNDWEYGIK